MIISRVTIVLLVTFAISWAQAQESESSSSTSMRSSGAAQGHETAEEARAHGAEGSVTTSLGTVVPQPSNRKITYELYAEDYYLMSGANYGSGSMYTDQFAGATYKVNNDLNYYLHQNFIAQIDMTQATAKEHTGNSLRLDDTEFAINKNKIFTWGHGGSFNASNRFFIPTGAYSQRGGEIAKIREILTFSQPLDGHFEVGFGTDYTLRAFSKNGFVNDFGENQRNRPLNLQNAFYVTAKPKPNSIVSSTIYAGVKDRLEQTFRDQVGGHTSMTYLDTSVTAQVSKMLALTLGAENDMQTGQFQEHTESLYRADETLYYFNAYATL